MTRHKTRYPSIYYRVNAAGERRYQISYRDSTGKRIFKTVDGNEKDAIRYRNALLERMAKGEKVVTSKLTVKELAEDYLRTQTTHLKDSTLATYSYSVDQYLIPKLGHLKVSDLGVDEVADFIAEMRQTLSPGTIRACLTPLSRMMQYAVRKGLASQNPVSILDRQERPKGTPRQMRILSTEEIGALLRASEKPWRLMFSTAIFSGLRVSELLNLKWEDVDFQQGLLRVKVSKTEAGVREVMIPDFLLQQLAEASLGKDSKHYVFGTAKGTRLAERRNVNRALTKALKKAKVEHVRFHDLRHTYASIRVAQGMNVVFIANQMGHFSPKMTLGVYAKLFDADKSKQEAREKMQEQFGGLVV